MEKFFDYFYLIKFAIYGSFCFYSHSQNPNGMWVGWLLIAMLMLTLHIETKIEKLKK